MKSLVHEASTIAKAIDQAWQLAGCPERFTVKVLEQPEHNFLGFVKRSAKIAFMYEEAPAAFTREQRPPRREEERSSRDQRQQPRTPQRPTESRNDDQRRPHAARPLTSSAPRREEEGRFQGREQREEREPRMFREDRREERPEMREARTVEGEEPRRMERSERSFERHFDRPERSERPERAHDARSKERNEERPERSFDRPGRDRSDRFNRESRFERPQRPERPGRFERHEARASSEDTMPRDATLVGPEPVVSTPVAAPAAPVAPVSTPRPTTPDMVWTPEVLAFAQTWLHDTLVTMGHEHPVESYRTHAENLQLTITVPAHVFEEANRERQLFHSLGILLLESLKKEFRKQFRGYKVVIMYGGPTA